MKKYILALCLLSFTLSCSYEDRLEQSGDLNIILMETISMPSGNVGDTVSFKVLASTNDVIKRMVLSEKNLDFNILFDSIKYEMVGELSRDENGYFSRDVKTLMVNYPVELSNVSVGDILSMRFSFTTNKGVTSDVTARIKVGNYLNHVEQKSIMAHPQSSNVTQTRFYSSEKHATFGLNAAVAQKDSIDVFVATLSMSSPYPQKMISPGSDKAKEYLDKLIPKPVYDQTIMRKTKFVKVETQWVDVNDDIIRALNFDNGTEEIDIAKDDRIGFLTQDGRKGVILIFGKTNFSLSIQARVQKVPEIKQ